MKTYQVYLKNGSKFDIQAIGYQIERNRWEVLVVYFYKAEKEKLDIYLPAQEVVLIAPEDINVTMGNQ